jgi:hypothetical protein
MTNPNDPTGFLLAEYKELRGEILKRSEIQHQLISFALVALAGLAAVGLRDSPSALLAYPMLVAFLATAWAYNDIQIAQLGLYIKYRIEYRLVGTSGWEHFISSLGTSKKIGALVKLATRGILWGSEVLAIVLYLLKREASGLAIVPPEIGGDLLLLIVSIAAIAFTLWALRGRDSDVAEIEQRLKDSNAVAPAPTR